MLQAATPGTPFSPGFSDSEPAFLGVGTEVSAKYKGAFCEAKIKNVTQLVKCRVTLKNSGATIVVTHDNVKGPLKVGAVVEAKHQGQYIEATIVKIMDASQYTVIFDDGDETTLRRTSLCLKSGKHYSESESLDHLPLTNPEHFGNPVGMGVKGRRSRRIGRSSLHPSTPGLQNPSDDESAEGDGTAVGSIDDEDSAASSLTQQSEVSSVREKGGSNREGPIGKVYIVEYNAEKRGNKAKDLWFPALCVTPDCPDAGTVRPADDELLVKSFKDNRFYTLARRVAREFDHSIHTSLTDSNSSAALRSAVEKTISYLDKGDLPGNWDSESLLGPPDSEANEVNDVGPPSSELDSAADDEGEDERDAGPSEEKDRFVAQLYKYMDERGTPIQRSPTCGGKDLDLFRLYRVVYRMGGYNRVTAKGNWKIAYSRLGLAACSSEGMENIAVNQLKAAYKKFLLNFTDFYRKLGYSSAFVNSPMTSRSTSRPGRNERGWKGPEKEASIPATKTRRRRSLTESEPRKDESPGPPASIESQDTNRGEDDDEKPGRRGSMKRCIPGRRSLKKKVEAKDEESADEAEPDVLRTPAGHESDIESDETIGRGR